MTKAERDKLEKEQRLLMRRVLVGTHTFYEDQERLAQIKKLLRGEDPDADRRTI